MAYHYDHVASAASLIARVTSHEINAIEMFQESILDAEREAKKRLTKIPKGSCQEAIESLVEDWGILFKDVRPLTDALAILALYRIVETNTKWILQSCWSKRKVKKCYEIQFLAEELKNDFQVDVENITNYEAIKKLRYINNAIKHKWEQGHEPKNLGTTFNRLKQEIPDYLRALALAVLPHSRIQVGREKL